MMMMKKMMVVTAMIGVVAVGRKPCPWTTGVDETTWTKLESANVAHEAYAKQVADVNWTEVKESIKTFLTTSQETWPADYGNYGPLFIRLAWHSAGSYRTSDGRGGLDGGRQRFDPERSWADNTNLDKARGLLYDVKKQYPQVSWGDLIALTGTTAIESMGGPVLGFCAGRVDDANGADSELLGPTYEQDEYAPCPVNGTCQVPLGTTTIGLIYLNPEGPMGEPDAVGSASDVRDSFGRMAMNDSETVALIGGGHAFGKTHGACPNGAGPAPNQDPVNPWPGLCGSGVGVDAFTSGIEGPWTTDPTKWDNEYFHNLLDFQWTPIKGPGDAWQWQTVDPADNPVAPAADGESSGKKSQPVMLMTSDVSLTKDPAYLSLVHHFADDPQSFDTAFEHAWYKLMTRDMGPYARCVNSDSPDLPPPQDFQYYLPKNAASYDVDAVKSKLQTVFEEASANATAIAVHYAFNCASTFRQTDYLGGCNGARIRFDPGKNWRVNGYGSVVQQGTALLQPVKTAFPNISWADLIVLAGGEALSFSCASCSLDWDVPFCPGRADAQRGDAWEYLEPALAGDVNETAGQLKETIQRAGLANRDFVALLGAVRALGDATPPFAGHFSSTPAVLDNTYFNDLFSNDYQPWVAPSGAKQYKAVNSDLVALSTDINVKFDAELAAIVQDFAADNSAFLDALLTAWPNLMNADRFDTPSCLPGLSAPSFISSHHPSSFSSLS